MLLIDGNNLWYAAMLRGEPLSGISRTDLVRVLDRYAGHLGERVVVVLDGYPRSATSHAAGRPATGRSVAAGRTAEQQPAGERGPVEHVYAGSQSADEVISQWVADSTEPHRVTVVTTDRELARQVRKRRAKVTSAEVFAGRLERWVNRPVRRRAVSEPAGKASGLGGVADSINDWLRYFDLTVQTSDIMTGERAGSREGGLPQSPCKSESSPIPKDAVDGYEPVDELGRFFRDVQPLKRRKHRRT